MFDLDFIVNSNCKYHEIQYYFKYFFDEIWKVSILSVPMRNLIAFLCNRTCFLFSFSLKIKNNSCIEIFCVNVYCVEIRFYYSYHFISNLLLSFSTLWPYILLIWRCNYILCWVSFPLNSIDVSIKSLHLSVSGIKYALHFYFFYFFVDVLNFLSSALLNTKYLH